MAKIYTKFGDKGQTALVGGQRVSKSDPRIEAYGTIDELNSCLGIVRSSIQDVLRHQSSEIHKPAGHLKAIDAFSRMDADLEKLQNWLFDFGSLLASTPEDRSKYSLSPLRKEYIDFFEERIDTATVLLTPLKNFILPAGHFVSSYLHLSRTIARRAERLILQLDEGSIPENGVPFINRISDYLFVMARLANHHLGVDDVKWKKEAL